MLLRLNHHRRISDPLIKSRLFVLAAVIIILCTLAHNLQGRHFSHRVVLQVLEGGGLILVDLVGAVSLEMTVI